jgi:hypothetical protein
MASSMSRGAASVSRSSAANSFAASPSNTGTRVLAPGLRVEALSTRLIAPLLRERMGELGHPFCTALLAPFVRRRRSSRRLH